jgi:hypothetical protein
MAIKKTILERNEGKKEPLYSIVGDINECNHYEISRELPQETKNTTTM